MEKQEIKFVRYTASEGKSLQWTQKVWSFTQHKEVEEVMFAEKTTIIEEGKLVGKVEEVPFEFYNDWYEKNKNTLGLSSFMCC